MSSARSPITTHILDVSLGKPAANVAVRLARAEGERFTELARGTTDTDGRVTTLLAPGSLMRGTYRLSFDVGAYFAGSQRASFYPHVDVVFAVEQPEQHHHVPLLLSPFGYSTYRGS
jgi:5-hydroxyisourate hydrolase